MTTLDQWSERTELASQTLGPITHSMIALFAGASNDHNALHLDPNYALAAGLPGVIGQGMLTMALLGRYLTSIAPQQSIERFGVRFVVMSRIGDTLRCTARIVSLEEDEAGRRRVSLQLTAAREGGDVLVSGQAVIRICDRRLPYPGSAREGNNPR